MVNGGGAAVIVRLKMLDAVCGVALHESVAVTLSEDTPEPVGVPLNSPALDKDNPVGTPVAPQLTGNRPPEETNWNEYIWP